MRPHANRRLVVWCLWPLQSKWNVLHCGTKPWKTEWNKVALLQGAQLLPAFHNHDDPALGLLKALMPGWETRKDIWGCSQMWSFLEASETNSIGSLPEASGYVTSPGFLTMDSEPIENLPSVHCVLHRERTPLVATLSKGRNCSSCSSSKCYWIRFWTSNSQVITATCFMEKENKKE